MDSLSCEQSYLCQTHYQWVV